MQKTKISNLFFKYFFKHSVHLILKILFLTSLHGIKKVVPQEGNMANKNSIPSKVIFTDSMGEDVGIYFWEPQLNPNSDDKIRHSFFKIILLFCTFSLSLLLLLCICQDQTNLFTIMFLTFKITFGPKPCSFLVR